MNRWRLAAVAVWCSIATAVASTQQAPLFRAAAEVVAVDATVTRGRTPITGLTPQDFVLTDNGVPQVIDSVTPGSMPLDITIVLDFSNSVRDDFEEFVRSASAMQRLLRAEDRWRWLGIFMEARELLPMRPATDPLPPIRRPGSVTATALADTVFLALVRPSEPARRHLVIVFTDGDDSWSILEAQRLPAIAGRADAVLHVVTAGQPPLPQQVESGFGQQRAIRWRASQNALFDAARESGGSVQRLTTRAEAFARIIEEFRTAYVLRYSPKGVDTPGWHTVAVALANSRGVTIRARRGYERR